MEFLIDRLCIRIKISDNIRKAKMGIEEKMFPVLSIRCYVMC